MPIYCAVAARLLVLAFRSNWHTVPPLLPGAVGNPAGCLSSQPELRRSTWDEEIEGAASRRCVIFARRAIYRRRKGVALFVSGAARFYYRAKRRGRGQSPAGAKLQVDERQQSGI